ncbi:MAG: 4a-hydroxytetrahydrobiopterin dehydratase [Bacteroidetes bacterium]|nr:4a-hydroxytetrahydrobiopterin dehydratase [Bacteroidota bacterium]
MKWKKKDNFLEKNFKFNTFSEALNFVNMVAEIAEKLNHHPEIFLHDYNQVKILITTHSEGKISMKDHNLADLIDQL